MYIDFLSVIFSVLISRMASTKYYFNNINVCVIGLQTPSTFWITAVACNVCERLQTEGSYEHSNTLTPFNLGSRSFFGGELVLRFCIDVDNA